MTTRTLHPPDQHIHIDTARRTHLKTALVTLDQALACSVVGSPETVAAKIASAVKTLGLSRFDMKYSNGALPHDKLMRSIELYGTNVAPRVRELDLVEKGRPEAGLSVWAERARPSAVLETECPLADVGREGQNGTS